MYDRCGRGRRRGGGGVRGAGPRRGRGRGRGDDAHCDAGDPEVRRRVVREARADEGALDRHRPRARGRLNYVYIYIYCYRKGEIDR